MSREAQDALTFFLSGLAIGVSLCALLVSRRKTK